MAKKYVRILNWKDYPHVKGYHYSDMCKRTYCKCGFVAVGELLDECPICGNKEFIGPYQYTETYKLNGEYIIRQRDYVRVDKNDQEETNFKTVSQTDTSAITNSSLNLDEVRKHIDLDSHRIFGLGCKMFDYLVEHKYFVRDEWEYGKISLYKTLMVFAHTCYNANDGSHNMKFFDELVTAMNGGDISAKINYITRMTVKPKQILQNLYDVPTELLPLTRDLQVFYRLVNNPDAYIGIDEEVCNIIAAYYSGGFISDPLYLLDLIKDFGFDSVTRYLFIRAFKELYANPGYRCENFQEILDWIKDGKSFENIKDYYLQRNRDRFTVGLNAKKYDEAMSDVFTHPADAIIAISKIK